MKNRKKFVGIMAATLMIGGVAFAAWTANGTGTGTAEAIEAQGLTITPEGADDLYPGGPFDLTVDISNPNPYPVEVTSIFQTEGDDITADAAHTTAGCDGTTVEFTDQSGTWSVPAATDSSTPGVLEDVLLAGSLSMPNEGAQDACQGATFTVPLDLLGASDS
jgi:hypothetical protein